MKNYFSILDLTRDDLNEININASQFTDDQMEAIAEEMGKQILNTGDYNRYLEQAMNSAYIKSIL